MLPIIFKQIKYNRTATSVYTGRSINYIVIHYTANYSKGANTEAHYNYFNNANRNASADFFIDDKSIWQINDYNKYYTWAVGDGDGKYGVTNRNSISIEMCVNSDSNFNKTLQNTVELTAYLMKELNIDINHVVRHFDASKKLCPLMFCGNTQKDKDWELFKDKINKEFIINNIKPLSKKIKITATALNIRSLPNTKGDILGQVYQNDIIDVFGITSDGWYKIENGFISGKYTEEYIPEKTELEKALDILSSQSVPNSNDVIINSPQVWIDGIKNNSINPLWIEALIIKFSKYIKGV